MVKIKLECWWTNSGAIRERFIKQFVSDEDLTLYSFVEEGQDITIVFGRTDWDKIETCKDDTIYFSQEPLWSPNQPIDNIHDYCSRIFISDKRIYPDRCEYIETLIPMFYGGSGEYHHDPMFDWSQKIKDIVFEKNKNLSMTVTKNYCSYYQHLEKPEIFKLNQELRTDLGIMLSQYKNIDISGIHWENNGSNLKGEIWNKHVGLNDYKFSIGCENTIQKNYISEKFWDIILTDTVPIYVGCENIKDYIPENTFFNLTNLNINDMVSVVLWIESNADELYKLYYPEVKKLKQEFFSNPIYNLWEKIKQEINK